jgi:hypothetical protein
MELFQLFLNDLKRGQNYDVYITVAIAATVTLLGLFGIVDNIIISAAILATLTLVSSSLLVNRRDNQSTRETLNKLQNVGTAFDRFLVMEYSREEIIQRVSTSHEIYMWGTALEAHIPLLKDYIRQGLDTGLKVKCLLVKPSSAAVKMAVFRAKHLKETEIDAILCRNLTILADLASENLSGKLEYRVVDYLAPYTMYVFDPKLSSGYLLAPMSTFRVSNVHRRPTFKLTCRHDKEWFDYFVDQFEQVWNEAEAFEPN